MWTSLYNFFPSIESHKMLLKHSQIILHKVVLIFCIKLEYYKIQVISEMPFGPHLVKKY